MKTKTLSQIALALAVGSSAVFFTACGADEEKRPSVMLIKWGSSIGGNPLTIISKDDETIIKDVVARGRNGECPLQKDVLNGEKLAYDKSIDVPFSEDVQSGKVNCEPKNGKLEVEVKTNFGTYTYEK